uniref:Uncharacterized protein n=1 Tax=Pithovirus LCPAC406 TaxID=2506599 RepID=A0A481ZD12_9VIRU|nr:MAG: hypothetical protein LCPAC406_01180 [Pithovirus LCPAC406]
MSTLRDIVDKYFYSISDDNRLTNSAMLINLPSHKYFSLFRWYEKTIKTVLLSDDVDYVSGFGCFAGSILFALNCGNTLKCTDELFRYSTLYILLDHYLDDPTIKESNKRRLIKNITKIFLHCPIDDLTDPRERDLVTSFNLILTKIPSAKANLSLIFFNEIIGYRLQSNHGLTREEYLSMAINKGGHMLNAIESILKISPTPSAFDLGSCIQLDDDLRDVTVDIRDNINTIATHDLRADGNLDKLALYLGEKLHNLDENFIVFKVVLMGMLVHTVVVNTYFTEELRDSIEEYLVIDKRLTHELLMKIIREEME